MRRIWWLVLGASALALAGLAVALVLIVTRDGEEEDGTVATECQAPERSGPAGNADISERVTGRGFDRTIVIRAKDKQSGAPLQDAKVTVRAEMACPPPSRPVMTVSATHEARQAATTTSAALPPSSRISAPASAVAGWPAATALRMTGA